MKTKTIQTKKRGIWYSRLPVDELEKLAASVDRIIPIEETRPLTSAERAVLRRAREKHRIGRPPIGDGADKLRVSLERTLRKQVDAYAKKHGISRSQLIAESLRRMINAA